MDMSFFLWRGFAKDAPVLQGYTLLGQIKKLTGLHNMLIGGPEVPN